MFSSKIVDIAFMGLSFPYLEDILVPVLSVICIFTLLFLLNGE